MTLSQHCDACTTRLGRINRTLIRCSRRMKASDTWCIINGARVIEEMAEYMGFDVRRDACGRVLLQLSDRMKVHPASLERMFVAHLLNRCCPHRVRPTRPNALPEALGIYRYCSGSSSSIKGPPERTVVSSQTAPSATLSPQLL